MVKSYAIVVSNLKAFADAHLEIKRFKASFLSQIEPFAAEDRTFPILYATPSSVQNKRYTNTYSFTLRCIDKLNNNQDNEIAILNSTEQILRDLAIWLKESQNGLELENEPLFQPLENYLFDGFIGWEATFDFSGPAFSNECSIPFVDGFLVEYPNGNCDAIYHTKYLTCETLIDCETIQDILTNVSLSITGATQNGQNIPVIDKKIALLDTYVTGVTKNGTIATFTNNSGNTFTLTGLTDTYITGGTISRTGNLSNISLINNSGNTVSIGSIFDTITTGATISGQTMIFTNNSGNTFTVTGFDAFTTGFTYDNANLISLQRNQGQTNLTVRVNTMTGLTITSTTNNLNGITITKTVSGGTSTTDRGLRINNNWTAVSNAVSLYSSIIGIDIQNNNTINYSDQSSNVVTNLHLLAGGTTIINSGASNNQYGIVRINPTFIDSCGGNNSNYRFFELIPTVTLSGTTSSIPAGNVTALRVAPNFTAGSGSRFLFGMVGISSAFNISTPINNIGLISFQSIPTIGSQNSLSLTGYYHAPTLLGSTGATITYHRAFWNTTGDNVFCSTSGVVMIGTTTSSGDKLQVVGNLNLTTAGNKIKIATGTNASVGTVVLTGGTATVNTTAVSTNSIILLTTQVVGGTIGVQYISARVNGVSFTITSTSIIDTSTVGYQIIN